MSKVDNSSDISGGIEGIYPQPSARNGRLVNHQDTAVWQTVPAASRMATPEGSYERKAAIIDKHSDQDFMNASAESGLLAG